MTELTRGQKAAQTRAQNKAARESEASALTQVSKIETVKIGSGVGVSLDDMRTLVEGLEAVETTIQGFASFTGAALMLTVEGVNLRCIHDGTTWRIEVVN